MTNTSTSTMTKAMINSAVEDLMNNDLEAIDRNGRSIVHLYRNSDGTLFASWDHDRAGEPSAEILSVFPDACSVEAVGTIDFDNR